MSLAQNILDESKNQVAELILYPSSGGVFEVVLDDQLIFSKKKWKRFPEEDEVEAIVREQLND